MLIYEDLTCSKVSVDKITLFSLRPPELRKVISKPLHYFRWFHTELSKSKRIKGDDMNDKISIDLSKSCWINGLQQKVRIRRRALPELMLFIDSLTVSDDNIGMTEMIDVFKKINVLVTNGQGCDDDIDDTFCHFVFDHLIFDDTKIVKHLPIPVFSFL